MNSACSNHTPCPSARRLHFPASASSKFALSAFSLSFSACLRPSRSFSPPHFPTLLLKSASSSTLPPSKAFPFSKSVYILLISSSPNTTNPYNFLQHHLSLFRLGYPLLLYPRRLVSLSLACVRSPLCCFTVSLSGDSFSSWRYHPAFMGWRCGWQEKARRVPLEVVLAVAFMCLGKACFALCSRQIRRFIGRSAWRFSW